jgi:hypothetical protein
MSLCPSLLSLLSLPHRPPRLSALKEGAEQQQARLRMLLPHMMPPLEHADAQMPSPLQVHRPLPLLLLQLSDKGHTSY